MPPKSACFQRTRGAPVGGGHYLQTRQVGGDPLPSFPHPCARVQVPPELLLHEDVEEMRLEIEAEQRQFVALHQQMEALRGDRQVPSPPPSLGAPQEEKWRQCPLAALSASGRRSAN